MIDAARLEGFRPDAILVDTARGELLDGLPTEPPPAHPLLDAWRAREDWLSGRLVVTPHNAFHSDAAGVEMRRNAAETVRLFLAEGALRNRIVE